MEDMIASVRVSLWAGIPILRAAPGRLVDIKDVSLEASKRNFLSLCSACTDHVRQKARHGASTRTGKRSEGQEPPQQGAPDLNS